MCTKVCSVFAVVALTLTALAGAARAEETSPGDRPYASTDVWDFDSISPAPNAGTPHQIAAQEVYAAMTRMIESWNAHNLESYLATLWHSPALVWVEDGLVLYGWQAVHERYVRGFDNPDAMGHATLDRAQVRMLDADSAIILERWTVTFKSSRHIVTGVDTCDLKRVDGLWRVTVSHSSSLDE